VKSLTILLLTLLVTAWAPAQPLGKTLPEFDFQTLGGDSLKLSELREKSPTGVVLLTFWCTECASCRATEESLAQVTQQFAGQAKVVAVASSKDDTPRTVQAYLEKHKTGIEVLMDSKGRFARHLGVDTTTTTVILDQSGRVRYYGTLKRGKKFFAVDPLKQVIGKKIVGQPLGPLYG
jgi:peroxiredoxin